MVSRCSNKVWNAKLIRLYFDFFGRGLVPEIACANTVCCKPFSMRIAMINFQRTRYLRCRDPKQKLRQKRYPLIATLPLQQRNALRQPERKTDVETEIKPEEKKLCLLYYQ